MFYSTKNVYTLKRDIVTFSKQISTGLPNSQQKFAADMTYGILASKSCLLTDLADSLHEPSKKINLVDRLSRHLAHGIPKSALQAYLTQIKKWCPKNPVVHIDDSDIIKPQGRCFEALGIVRDGSRSTKDKSVYETGYHVTEATVLTTSHHPVSLFSRIHSSNEKGFSSVNTITFSAIQRAVNLFGNATFILDRGYDSNKVFLKLDELEQEYVIRLTSRRKLWFQRRWISAKELCNRRKGKVKGSFWYRGEDHEARLSHVKVQITASRKPIYLVLVYGITEHPMMLATNRPITCKEEVVQTARLYFSRWRIGEYFRSKKQQFRLEDFRVRKLKAINALNFYITVCMAFLARMTMRSQRSGLRAAILQAADPIKTKVQFYYYRFAKGIARILSYAKEGVKRWFRRKGRPSSIQLCWNFAR